MTLFQRKKTLRSRTKVKTERTFLKQVMWGILLLSVLVLVGALTRYVTTRPAFLITQVEVVGGETVAHDTVRALVLTELNGFYGRIIPKRFAYLYPHDAIVAELAKDERLYNIQVTRPKKTTVAVSFEEYVPAALWCLNDDDSSCYFMNENGYVFMKAPTLKGGALVRYILEGRGELHAGDTFPATQLTFGTQFIERAEAERGFRITSLRYTKDGDVVFYVNGGGTILASLQQGVDKTLDNLRAVLTSDAFSHIKPGNFQYVDVRFSNKVFVNETKPGVATSTGSTTDDVSSTTDAAR